MNDDPRSIALTYIEACGRKDWAEVARRTLGVYQALVR